MIDSGCQLNLSKGSAIPLFCWEKSAHHGSAIEGTPVSMTGKVADFPIYISNESEFLSLYRLDSIKEDCILGSEFLLRVSPFSVDNIKMLFSCTVNNQIVVCSLSFESQSKCKVVVPEPVSKPKVVEL